MNVDKKERASTTEDAKQKMKDGIERNMHLVYLAYKSKQRLD